MAESYLEKLIRAAQGGASRIGSGASNIYDELSAVGQGMLPDISRPAAFREQGLQDPSINDPVEGFKDIAYFLSSPGRALDRSVLYYSGGTPLFPEESMLSGGESNPLKPVFAGISPEELAKSEAKKDEAAAELINKHNVVKDMQIEGIRKRLESLQAASKGALPEDTFVAIGNEKIVRGGGKELFGGPGTFSKTGDYGTKYKNSNNKELERAGVPQVLINAMQDKQDAETARNNQMEILLDAFHRTKNPRDKEDIGMRLQMLQRQPIPGSDNLELLSRLPLGKRNMSDEVDKILSDIKDAGYLPQAVSRLRNLGLQDLEIEQVLSPYIKKQ